MSRSISADSPMARLFYGGPGMLTNKELLGLVLRTGAEGRSATELAGDLIDRFGNGFAVTEVRELMDVYGVGEAKAASVVSAIELSKRLNAAKQNNRVYVKCSNDAAMLLMEDMKDLPQEHFVCLCLNTKLKVIKRVTVSIGGLNSAPVHPRDVFRPAVKANAAAIIACHNHPSGDPTPSPEDIALTKHLIDAGKIMGVSVIDHIVIGDGCYTSLKSEGVIPEWK